MKRILVSTICGLLMVQLGACRGNSGQDAAEQSTRHATSALDVSWNLKTTEDPSGMPWTLISLIVNGNSFPVASGLAIEELPKDLWPDFKIPETALIASGGWWAGSGEVYYVIRDGDVLNVMSGFDGEEMSPDEAYTYTVLKLIDLSNLEADAKEAELLADGRHCFHYDDGTLSLDVELTIAEDKTVTGFQWGVIEDDVIGYYTSYESKISGTIDGSVLNLTIETSIEDDVQETQEFWTWEGLSISDGLHELERVVCRVPPMEISMELEERAEESPQCGMEERTVFSCLIAGTEKRVSVCASDSLTRTEGYIQFRFGTPDSIEFLFPEKLDRTQDQFLWQTIGYSGGWDTRIQFTNEDYRYQIYDQAFKVSISEKDLHGGVLIFEDGAEVDHLVCDVATLGPVYFNTLNDLYDLVPEGNFFEIGE